MSLLALPDEIISQIFSYLREFQGDYITRPAHKQRSLAAAALICHRASVIARPIIFRHISLRFSSRETKRDKLTPTSLFIRSLNANLALGSLTRGLHLFFDDYSSEKYWKIRQLMTLLSNLQELNISAIRRTAAGQSSPSIAFHSLLANDSLSSVTIRDDSVTADDLITYMSLGTIKSITVPLDYHQYFWEPSYPISYQPKSSSILELRLRPIVEFSTSTLHSLLSLPAGLRCLECPLPEQEYLQGPDDTSTAQNIFSPDRLTGALCQLSDSLIDLQLIKRQRSFFGPNRHDGTRLDLSAMKFLKRISLHSDCFFLPEKAFESTSPISHLLPPTIETLEIYFSEPGGLKMLLTAPVDDAKHSFPQNWMLELARLKNVCTPRLNRFIVHEVPLGIYDHRVNYDLIPDLRSWDYGPALLEQFELTGIYFNGLLAADEFNHISYE